MKYPCKENKKDSIWAAIAFFGSFMLLMASLPVYRVWLMP